MRTRTKGIRATDGGERIVDKQYRGERIFERLGRVSQDEAEAWLRKRQADIDARHENELRRGAEKLFAAGAAKYLIECEAKGVRTLDTIAYHVKLLLPYVGKLPMGLVCNDSFETFKADRIDDDEVSPTTVNRTLEVARTILNRAARVWRDDGKPWLAAPPLIEMLPEQPRKPCPITWAQQSELLPKLAAHLQRMVLFTLNTGARDDNVCGLRWDWERPVPELKRSVFVIPPEHFKSDRHHVLILNDVAWRIVEECRGMHKDFVFVWRRERVKNFHKAPAMEYAPIETMNNTGYQSARAAVGLERVRIHDLRHTFGHRLRAARVQQEDRELLLGHASLDMSQLYATASVAHLVEAANLANTTRDQTTLLQVVNG
jgi:integrase